MDHKKPRKKIPNDRKAALGYIRVSTEKQTKGLSLQNQKKTIRKYASLHNLHMLKIFSDNGSARKITSRPGLIDLLHMVKDKNIDAVIVYRLDRMFRNTKDALNIIEEFKRHGVAFHSFTEKIDTDSPQGRFFLTILASFATMEKGKYGVRDENPNIFVLVDESHRTNYGTIAAQMRRVFPNACYIGFTWINLRYTLTLMHTADKVHFFEDLMKKQTNGSLIQKKSI